MTVPISSWIGKYRVVELLGAGGMGEVYLVEESGTGARWALKTLRYGLPESEEWLRFMNEGQVHHDLHHANIAGFHEMFVCEGRPCMVLEYVDGETLFSYLQRRGPLPVDQALAVMAQLCAALSYLHARGVMHRDLKSANIKITSHGAVKLLDFGIAKVRRARGMTTVGTVVGTPEYLAPEQLSGLPSDTRSEIWALGLLGYEMLTGRLPFVGPDEGALYSAIRDVMPPPPSSLNADVPSAVDALVMKCLEKRPSRRYQSTADVLRALNQKPARSLKPKTWAAAAALALIAIWFYGSHSGGPDDLHTVTVEVVEGAADVYADGSHVGRTPYQTRGRIGELVRLELRKTGYLDQPVQFEVSERNTYSFTMQRASQ